MRTGKRSLQRAARRQRPVNAPPRQRGGKREQNHCGGKKLRAPQRGRCYPAMPGQVRRRARHCEFLTETRRLRSSSVPDTRQAVGMRLPASILWHSASVSGCDLGPHSMIYPTDGVAGRLAAYLCAGWLPRLPAPRTRHGRHSRLHGATCVLPLKFRASKSAPDFNGAAIMEGLALNISPLAINTTALCKGASPDSERAFGSAPPYRSLVTTECSALCAARCKGVKPRSPRTFTSAPASIRRSPAATAKAPAGRWDQPVAVTPICRCLGEAVRRAFPLPEFK